MGKICSCACGFGDNRIDDNRIILTIMDYLDDNPIIGNKNGFFAVFWKNGKSEKYADLSYEKK
jgi:hypothetical protein